MDNNQFGLGIVFFLAVIAIAITAALYDKGIDGRAHTNAERLACIELAREVNDGQEAILALAGCHRLEGVGR